jgi:hypothetical protein
MAMIEIDIDKLLENGQYDNAYFWCEEEFGKSMFWGYRLTSTGDEKWKIIAYGDKTVIRFQNLDDATLFTLSWL